MNKIKKLLLPILCLIIFAGCGNTDDISPTYDHLLQVYFINVGQADATLIILPNEETILIDAGLDHATTFDSSIAFPSWNNIQEVFDLVNIEKINHLVITHYHSDHIYFIANIINNYPVEFVYISGSTSTSQMYNNIVQSIRNSQAIIYKVSVGDKLLNEKKLLWQVVSTQAIKNPEDPNITSIATKLTYNEISFMFTGDMGSSVDDGEKIALNSNIDLKSDVLKVGHHGSAYASGVAFLSAVSPKYAIITTSSYTTTGHPHMSALTRLFNIKAEVLQSKDDGTILFTSNGNSLEYQTHIGE